MIQPDKDVLMAIHRLRSDPNFHRFVKWIYDSMIDSSLKNNGTKEDWLFRQNQGGNLRLSEIIEQVEHVEESLARAQETQKGMI